MIFSKKAAFAAFSFCPKKFQKNYFYVLQSGPLPRLLLQKSKKLEAFPNDR